MRRAVPAGEMVTDRTQWPPLLNDEEFAALETLIAKFLQYRKPKEPEVPAPDPIEVGQVWHAPDDLADEVIEVVGPVLPSEFETLGPTVAVCKLGDTSVWNVAVEDFGRVYTRLPFRREAAK